MDSANSASQQPQQGGGTKLNVDINRYALSEDDKRNLKVFLESYQEGPLYPSRSLYFVAPRRNDLAPSSESGSARRAPNFPLGAFSIVNNCFLYSAVLKSRRFDLASIPFAFAPDRLLCDFIAARFVI